MLTKRPITDEHSLMDALLDISAFYSAVEAASGEREATFASIFLDGLRFAMLHPSEAQQMLNCTPHELMSSRTAEMLMQRFG